MKFIYSWVKIKLISIKYILRLESSQTKQMFIIYTKNLSGKASSKEIKFANNQAKDLVRAAGISGVILLPGTVFILPILIKLGKKFNVEILPSSFKDDAYCPHCGSGKLDNMFQDVGSFGTMLTEYDCGYITEMTPHEDRNIVKHQCTYAK